MYQNISHFWFPASGKESLQSVGMYVFVYMCVPVTLAGVYALNSIGKNRMEVKRGTWVCHIEKGCCIVFGAHIMHINEIMGSKGENILIARITW